MNTEFLIDLGGVPVNVYMQVGFFDHMDLSYPPHAHPLPEMHVLLSGSAVLRCGEEDLSLGAGDALLIPGGVRHAYRSFEGDAKRSTFFVDLGEETATRRITCPKELVGLLSKEIGEYVLTGRENKLKALLSYIISGFVDERERRGTAPITNRRLIIDDFFSKRYNSAVTLDDLAAELGLSRKQTEREVKRITGNGFSEELTKRRINAAVILSRTTDLPLARIGELVGYATYSGFYKAYRRAISAPTAEDGAE